MKKLCVLCQIAMLGTWPMAPNLLAQEKGTFTMTGTLDYNAMGFEYMDGVGFTFNNGRKNDSL